VYRAYSYQRTVFIQISNNCNFVLLILKNKIKCNLIFFKGLKTDSVLKQLLGVGLLLTIARENITLKLHDDKPT